MTLYKIGGVLYRLDAEQMQLVKAGKKKKSPAWTRKEGQDPRGGLNEKGRASYKRETGGTLRRPVSAKEAKRSPKAAADRRRFCARMSRVPGPMKDEKGRPTRKKLALKRWDCNT